MACAILLEFIRPILWTSSRDTGNVSSGWRMGGDALCPISGESLWSEGTNQLMQFTGTVNLNVWTFLHCFKFRCTLRFSTQCTVVMGWPGIASSSSSYCIKRDCVYRFFTLHNTQCIAKGPVWRKENKKYGEDHRFCGGGQINEDYVCTWLQCRIFAYNDDALEVVKLECETRDRNLWHCYLSVITISRGGSVYMYSLKVQSKALLHYLQTTNSQVSQSSYNWGYKWIRVN